MSSSYVRSEIFNFLDDETGETVIDLSTQVDDFKQMLANENVQPNAPWLGVDFIGDDEIPVSLAATNEVGLYRESGLIRLHVCAEGKIGAQNDMLSRGESLRNLFRGRRIGSIVIESVSPINFGIGATLEFDGGYVSGTIVIGYRRDLSPGA